MTPLESPAKLRPGRNFFLVRRHHLDASGLRNAIKQAAKRVKIYRPIGPHTLCHSLATHLFEAGYDLRAIQELLGHKGVETTMIYPHVLKRGPPGVRSPVDRLSSGKK